MKTQHAFEIRAGINEARRFSVWGNTGLRLYNSRYWTSLMLYAMNEYARRQRRHREQENSRNGI